MNNFEIYTTDYISGVMSLRKPQTKSLEILDNILNNVTPSKNLDLKEALNKVKALYPICTNFEREFMSLSFVLATGVGKTRLMGAFITYLYTKHNIKNFFVVAPGTTVYNKLKKDLGDPSNPKYVFKGVGCFNNPPKIIADDDYRNKNPDLFQADVNIFIFNISKFDKENVKMRAINEVLGESFFEKLSKIDDLVMIMDEAHHYHAAKGANALNDLKPILGLELTATPYYNKGSKQIKFKNAVYEYPLSESIKDGYTRTPYALTRQDINFYNFGEIEQDRIMLSDAVLFHERIKHKLERFSMENDTKLVKPFIMVVCKDTEHAKTIADYVQSTAFKDGKYKNKTLLIHSNQSKSVREENVEKLLNLENSLNQIEIVIHVDMLKEGWDVNNLYTIVPLRTASSKILREQMIGRGLRLPFGKRTGDKEIDSVTLTAHDKFDEIIREAQSGESIFKAGNVIKAEELQKDEVAISQINIDYPDEDTDKAYEITQLERNKQNTKLLRKMDSDIKFKVSSCYTNIKRKSEKLDSKQIAHELCNKLEQDKDYGEIFRNNRNSILDYAERKAEEVKVATINKFIPIPKIKITEAGIDEYKFVDFDLDLSPFNHFPNSNILILQNLQEVREQSVIDDKPFTYEEDIPPEKKILRRLREKSAIDYEKCSDLLFKLIKQCLNHYIAKYGEDGMKSIVFENERDIAEKIYNQMMQEEHFYCSKTLIKEEVVDLPRENLSTEYNNFKYKKDLFQEPEGNITSNLFEGIKKGVFNLAKFDSHPELVFARILELDNEVKNWLRPNPLQFNIFYNNGRRYEPDFVVETENTIYLVEVKARKMMKDTDVLAKKERAQQYCKIATDWGKANNFKEWKYLFIPDDEIQSNSSFRYLANRYCN